MTLPDESAPFMDVRPAVQPDPDAATGDVPPTGAEPIYSPLPMYPDYPHSAPPYGAQPYSAPPYSAAYGAPPVPAPTRVGLMIGLTAIGLVIGLLIGVAGTALVLRRPAGPSSAQVGDPQAGGPQAGGPRAGGPSPAESTPSPTSSTQFSGDLRTLLLPAPRTSRPFAQPLTTDGTLTESQVASSYTDPERVMKVLEEDGFQAGAAVQWHDADDTEVLIKLYRLGSEEQARAFFLYNKLGYGDDATLSDQSPIDGIDESGCWVSTKPDNLGFVTTTGVTSKAGIYMLVRVYQPDKQNRPIAIAIMKDQYARLP